MKPSEKTFRKYKKSLKPFAEIYGDLVRSIEEKSTKELKYLLRYGDQLSETNCSWDVYEVFPFLSQIASKELRYREYIKRKQKSNK